MLCDMPTTSSPAVPLTLTTIVSFHNACVRRFCALFLAEMIKSCVLCMEG